MMFNTAYASINVYVYKYPMNLSSLPITGPCDSYYHYNPISNSCMRPVQSTRDWVYARDTYCHGSYRTKMITFSSDESLHWFEEWLNDEESPLPCEFQ